MNYIQCAEMSSRGTEVNKKTWKEMCTSKVKARRWRASLGEVSRGLGREEPKQGELSQGTSRRGEGSFPWEHVVNAKCKINFWLILCAGETSWPQGKALLMYNQPTMVPYLLLKFTHSYDLPTLADSQDSLSVLIWAHSRIFSSLEGKERKWKHLQNHGGKATGSSLWGWGGDSSVKTSENI